MLVAQEVDDFLKTLHEEKVKSQERRGKFSLHKLSFAAALFGLGSIKIENIDLTSLLYLVPFVAITFDLYIFGEDFKVKRIGEFFAVSSSGSCEEARRWEEWARKNRDNFQFMAPLLSTSIALVAAATVIWHFQPDPVLFPIWLGASVASLVLLPFYVRTMRRKMHITPGQKAHDTAIDRTD